MANAETLLSFFEARALVEAECARLAVRTPPVEHVPLLQAQGRVLAAPVFADRPLPPFNRATRDGFAARAADLHEGAVRVAGVVHAGEQWTGGPLGPGMSVAIMTGAPVPPGADCVVMMEHVVQQGEHVQLAPGRRMQAGDNIVPTGAEAAAGEVLLPAGIRLGPGALALAAACGCSELPVYAKPRVAILATGDELVRIETKPKPWQIRNSNSCSLAAQVLAAGGDPVVFDPLRDDEETIAAGIAEAARESSLLLLSGGVSAGTRDLVEPALGRHGAQFLFTGVRMQPGKPVVFGTLCQGSLPFFGLPGNPVSTQVCFTVFAAPVLAALAGQHASPLHFVQAVLEQPTAGRAGLTQLLPAVLQYSAEQAVVRTLAWQGSGDLAGTAQANCLLLSPESAGTLDAGACVTVLLTA